MINRIRVLYEKGFDEDSGYFYYVNTLTQETQWHKPWGLGTEELPCVTDEQQQEQQLAEYYYDEHGNAIQVVGGEEE